MLIEKEVIDIAKEKIGGDMFDMMMKELGITDYDERNKKVCCPWHHEDTPSLVWNPKSNSARCFGACGRNYDLIDVYMKKGMTYIEAVQKLFDVAGVSYTFGEYKMRSDGRGYKYPKPKYAENKNEVYSYWATRNISKETIDYLDIQQDENGNTLFQYYDLNDTFVMCKVRKSAPVPKGKTKIWHLEGADKQDVLYNINRINYRQPLIIACGEGDCAALIECGCMNSVSINGGDGNLGFIAHCWDFLQQFEEIIIVPDNDDSGEKFAKEVSARLGEYRIKIARVPKYYTAEDGERYKIKDVNELLYFCGKDAVRDMVASAAESEIQAVVDYTYVEDEDRSRVGGFISGFEDLDTAIGKFYVGTTNIITGVTSSGKSSFLSSLICRSVDQGYPAFVYSGELSNASLKNWVLSVHAGQRGVEKVQGANTSYYRVKPAVRSAVNECYRGQLFFYKDSFSHKTSDVMATAESVCRKYGVKTFFFDNLTSVDLSCKDDSKWIKQEEFIREVIDFSKKWQVVCFVVIHPKKMDQVRRMNVFDLQGVAAAANLAHRIISLYRVGQKDKKGVVGRNGKYITEPMKGSVVVEVLKDRYGSANGKEVSLYYDEASRRFYSDPDNLDYRYSWDSEKPGLGTPLPYGTKAWDEDQIDDTDVFGEVV